MEFNTHSLADAELELAETFELISNVRPKVTIAGRDSRGCVVVGVGYPGDQLVAAMQVEAFVVEKGDTVRHRSQLKDGNTVLVYQINPR